MGQTTCSESTLGSCHRHVCSHAACKACKHAIDGPTEWSPTPSQPLFTDDIGNFEPPAVLDVNTRTDSPPAAAEPQAASPESKESKESKLALVAAKAISRQIGQRPEDLLERCWENLREEFNTQVNLWESMHLSSRRSADDAKTRPEMAMRKELETALTVANQDSAAAVRALEAATKLAGSHQRLLSRTLLSAVGAVLKAERVAQSRQRLARMLVMPRTPRVELDKDLEAKRKRSLEALFAACELTDQKMENRARQLMGLGPKEPSTPSTSIAATPATSSNGLGEADDGHSPQIAGRGVNVEESAAGCINGQGGRSQGFPHGDANRVDAFMRVAELAAQRERRPSKVIEFNVTLDKTHGSPLGIDVDGSDGETIIIDAVKPGGLVEVWNEVYPDMAVEDGDIIVRVNGIRNNALLMLEECKQNQILEFVMNRRIRRRHR